MKSMILFNPKLLFIHFQFYYKNIRRARSFMDIGNIPDFRPMSRLFCQLNSFKSAVCDKISRKYRHLKAFIIVYKFDFIIFKKYRTVDVNCCVLQDQIPGLSIHSPTGTSLKVLRHFDSNYRART